MIPRPETEELAAWIAQAETEAATLLDVGTGSGCIAATLALALPGAQVYAADISDTALETAARNCRALGAGVILRKADALSDLAEVFPGPFDVIVSNPVSYTHLFEVRGPIRGGEVDVDGSVSSQFITGLMLALPLARHDTTIHVRSAVSTPHLDMTIDTAARFGVEICHNDYEEFYIEGGQRYSPACLLSLIHIWFRPLRTSRQRFRSLFSLRRLRPSPAPPVLSQPQPARPLREERQQQELSAAGSLRPKASRRFCARYSDRPENAGPALF